MTRTYEGGLKNGYWKDADSFLETMTDEVMAKGVEKIDIQGYGQTSFEGDKAGGGVYTFAPIYDENFVPTSKEGNAILQSPLSWYPLHPNWLSLPILDSY